MDEAGMTGANSSHGPQRRRSPRLGSPQAASLECDNKRALGAKRLITVRKIAPRKTAARSEHDKENTPNRPEPNKNTPNRPEPNKNTPNRPEPNKNTPNRPEPNKNTPNRPEQQVPQKKQKVGTPEPVSGRRPSSSAGRKKKQQARMPSPILPSTPPVSPRTPQPAAEPEDAVWSQKVRRSYSRHSDRSLHSPEPRDTLFGFERLKTPEVASNRTERSRTALDGSGSLFTSLLEAEEGCAEPDPNIPGVAVVKERRRRRKVQQIHPEELDALAARMNQEFREAEDFQLVVE